MNTQWHFIDSGASAGSVNMEVDGQLALQLGGRTGNPTLRLYRWNPWAISLGHHQNESDIDASRCATDNIEIVRRPTGGRAILHAEELTYSVVMYAGGMGVVRLYNEISKALVAGLRQFGVAVEVQRTQPNFRNEYRRLSSIPCFASSARYEIEWRGRKLVGSAQRRYSIDGQEVVLQHGSILCGPAHRLLTRYIAGPHDRARQILDDELRTRTTDLSEISPGGIAFEDLAFCIRRGFETEWGVTFSHIHPTSLHHKEYLLA